MVSGLWQPTRGILQPNQHWRRPQTTAVDATISNTLNTTGGTGTSSTYTNAAIGTAAVGRRVIVGITSGKATGAYTITGVTIGGNAAAQVKTETASGGGATVVTDIWILQVDTGTTATIVVSYSASVTAAAVSVWAAYDLTSSTATDTGNSTANPMTDTLNISAGGVAVGMLSNFASGGLPSHTWVGLSERVDLAAAVGAFEAYSSADGTFAAAQTGLTITATPTAQSAGALVMASFR